MATVAPATTAIARGDTFYVKMVAWLSAIIVVGFVQFALRGYSHVETAPLYVHLHAAAMLSWLVLLNVQANLVRRENLAAHRTLGVLGLLLALFITGMGMYSGLRATELHRVPPFFSNAYFIALSGITVLAFVSLVCGAVARRTTPAWHKRLMIGALVVIMEPAFGRLLPMPLMGMWGEWTIMAIQVGIVGIMMRHDTRELGRIHPASQVAALAVVLTHVLITLVAMLPPVVGLAARLAARA